MPPFLSSLRLKNLLSFGPEGAELPMRSLNVLIGANGSGKSNLVEALSLLGAAPDDVAALVRAGGGVGEWLWKGEGAADRATVEVVLSEGAVNIGDNVNPALRYYLTFGAEGSSFTILDERLENRDAAQGAAKPFFYFGYENGRPMLSLVGSPTKRNLERLDVDPTRSILAQRKDPEFYPELTRVAELFSRMHYYRDWSFGHGSPGLFSYVEAPLRGSCSADVPTGYLSERFDNMPARLLALMRHPNSKRALLNALAEFSDAFLDAVVVPEGGRLRLYLVEAGREVSSSRLSDGTLRFLALVAILIDPSPAALTVIEEPELGMHPDVLPVLAKLLVDASARGQLVVTTHSELLVSALSDTPESVVVCEKHDGRTMLKRLESAEVAPFLESYRLGDAWLRGMVGGTRW